MPAKFCLYIYRSSETGPHAKSKVDIQGCKNLQEIKISVEPSLKLNSDIARAKKAPGESWPHS